MDFDEYQKLAERTAGDSSYAILGLGIAGEAGEVADLVKKHLGHGHTLEVHKLVKELGDVLWYVAMLAREAGVPLSDVARVNVKKLQARYPEGFDSERSKNRGEA